MAKQVGKDAQGAPLVCVRQTEEERAALLASIMDSSLAIIAETPDGLITCWNRGAELMYGYSADEIIGKSFSVLIDAGRQNEMAETRDQIRNGGRVDNFKTLRTRKDGTVIWVSLSASPIIDSGGAIVGVSSIARDLAESALADERLRAASQYARSLIEASRDPLVIISPEGKITDVNEATIKVTGVDREVLVEADFFEYFTEPGKARETYKQVFEKGNVADYPLTIRAKDGRLTDVLFNASVYKDAAGNALGVSAVARDVTEQKKAQAEVAELRTKEVERLAELERFQKLTVGRELKMIELKKEIADLMGSKPGSLDR